MKPTKKQADILIALTFLGVIGIGQLVPQNTFLCMVIVWATASLVAIMSVD
jgi:hypothetical protein